MRVLKIALVWLCATAAWANSYSTTFPLSQNPLNEGGAWVNGKQVGVQWTDCASKPGLAFGTQPANSPSQTVNDATCNLSGAWAQNQTVNGTVFSSGSRPWGYFEVELRLNSTISPNSITGYEFNCSVTQSNPYVNIVRWDGPLGGFTTLATRASSSDYCKSGDTLTATNVNGLLTFTHNGKVALSVSDTTYTAGAPGMGFYAFNNPGYDQTYGFSAFAASDSGTPPPPPPPPTCPAN